MRGTTCPPHYAHLHEIILRRYVLLLLLAFCTPEEVSLSAKCSTLTSDAILISLFRNNAAQLPCPIKGPLEFTYSVNEGECNSPRSRAEACTQDSRLLLRYQACANVHSSESVGQYSFSTVTLRQHHAGRNYFSRTACPLNPGKFLLIIFFVKIIEIPNSNRYLRIVKGYIFLTRE